MAIAVSWGRPYTVHDLEGLPDDGRRHELVEGALVVTPAPGTGHQRCVLLLGGVLDAAAPPSAIVLPAPFDWVAGPSTVFQPDVVVARRADVGPQCLERPPLLVVEVLSPGTRAIDLGAKRQAYQDAGVPAYWLVDPGPPSLTVLRPVHGAYVETAVVSGDEAYEADWPFPVTVVPARLVD
jgi:Uma2 family endonuclease